MDFTPDWLLSELWFGWGKVLTYDWQLSFGVLSPSNGVLQVEPWPQVAIYGPYTSALLDDSAQYCRPNFSAVENGLNCLLAIFKCGDQHALGQLKEDFYSLLEPFQLISWCIIHFHHRINFVSHQSYMFSRIVQKSSEDKQVY